MIDNMKEACEVTNTATSSELTVYTAKTLKIDGIEYTPEFTSAGMKIPCCYFDTVGKVNRGFYILLPKEEIIKCFKNYLPEILNPDMFKKEEE